MHGQARELRQDRKVATATTFSQCRGVPGHLFWFGLNNFDAIAQSSDSADLDVDPIVRLQRE